MDPVYTKRNAECGCEARVWSYGGTFTVSLYDVDSGETLPSMKRVNDLETAKRIADDWAKQP